MIKYENMLKRVVIKYRELIVKQKWTFARINEIYSNDTTYSFKQWYL